MQNKRVVLILSNIVYRKYPKEGDAQQESKVMAKGCKVMGASSPVSIDPLLFFGYILVLIKKFESRHVR